MSRHTCESLKKAFGAALREARTARGLSQEELALRGDFDRTYISLLELGKRMPTIGVVKDLGAALNTAPGQLVARALALEAACAGGSSTTQHRLAPAQAESGQAAPTQCAPARPAGAVGPQGRE